jgi:hypothetical protein
MNETEIDTTDAMIRDLVDTLAKVINGAGKSRQISAEAMVTADVPVALLKAGRDLLEQYRDTEFSTPEVKRATNRVWG